ncbi:MAG: dihydropteroate synthase [Actinobacteria bacterium]|uniref:dihydropteroate synthase n=1 Tax=freshwater metagenome TaxID=449393 RepID=A0A6J6KT26_9ZZZZ|nr:dihydropteroate synthase [Actinomycetota bacterium]
MLHPSGLPENLRNLDRTLVMGVLNVTPDSFSDGGRFDDTEIAISHALQMIEDGADIIDIGGESTRPGSERISVQVELDRVLPVIAGLVNSGVAISIDTMRAEVARAAIEAGACMINDVSGGKSDPEMLSYVSTLTVPYILMHWRGPSNIMNTLTDYNDVVADVTSEISKQVDVAVAAGIARERIAIDPGIGFAKTVDQNWPILKHLEVLEGLGLPILMGASRKKFLGELLAKDGVARDSDERESATTAISTLMAARGLWAVRVHDVKPTRDAIAVVDRIAKTS